jgi:hypothetical protein
MTAIRNIARVIVVTGLVTNVSLPGLCGCSHFTTHSAQAATQFAYSPQTCTCNRGTQEYCGGASCHCARSGQQGTNEPVATRSGDGRSQLLEVIVHTAQGFIDDVTIIDADLFYAASRKCDQSLVVQQTRLNC